MPWRSEFFLDDPNNGLVLTWYPHDGGSDSVLVCCMEMVALLEETCMHDDDRFLLTPMEGMDRDVTELVRAARRAIDGVLRSDPIE